jgi:hypothetical protein
VYEHFPREQVHVMDSEAFFADPSGEYRELVDFLGLRRWEPPSFDKHNARPSKPMPEDAFEFLTQHYRAHDAELAALLGRAPAWSAG